MVRLVTAICLTSLIISAAHASEIEPQSFETFVPEYRLKWPAPMAAGDSCSLDNSQPSDTVLGFFSGIESGDAVVGYYDPSTCGSPTYPFEIQTISFPLFDRNNDFDYPVELDIIVYSRDSVDVDCWAPGVELCRVSVSADEATFDYPNIGTVSFTTPCCIGEPVFIGIEYTDPSAGPYPSIVFDVISEPDECELFYLRDSVWYDWDVFWNPQPGRPLFTITGETVSDACCVDGDGDSVCDIVDNCPLLSNPTQADADSDGIGDACDDCPNDFNNDIDGDGFCADVDNCPSLANPSQADGNSNGIGDACENCCVGSTGDVNGDSVDADPIDLSYFVDFLFGTGPSAPCPEEADINGDATPADPIDLSFLVDYLFNGGTGPAVCP